MAPPLSLIPRTLAAFFATATLTYAIVYFRQPIQSLEVFDFDHPPHSSDTQIINVLTSLLGAKVCFISAAMYAAAAFGSMRVLGWTMIGASAVAGMDGVIVGEYVGRGEWNHWGYGGVEFGLGFLCVLGVFGRG